MTEDRTKPPDGYYMIRDRDGYWHWRIQGRAHCHKRHAQADAKAHADQQRAIGAGEALDKLAATLEDDWPREDWRVALAQVRAATKGHGPKREGGADG